MKYNKQAYLGLLGLLGLIGIPTQNYALFGFFGFFGFFGLLRIHEDETFHKHTTHAATHAFTISTIGLAITMTLTAMLENISVAMIGIAITFALQIITYSTLLHIYENNE